MKRILTGLALASAAALITASPAQAAAPKNPVVAVKKQFVAGKGVKFIDRVTVVQGRMRGIIARRTGTLQFGASGVVASDVTGKLNLSAADLGDDASEIDKALAAPERSITVGKSVYLSGGLWSTVLPEGKTWLKAPLALSGGVIGVYGQPLNIIAEPATFKTLLKGAKPAAGGYTGKITLGELRKVSSSFRGGLLGQQLSGKALKGVISWKLSVDGKGLPQRLVAAIPMSALDNQSPKGSSLSIDTRFSGWGSKVSITAPPADEVADKPESGEDGEDLAAKLQEIPLGSIAQ